MCELKPKKKNCTSLWKNDLYFALLEYFFTVVSSLLCTSFTHEKLFWFREAEISLIISFCYLLPWCLIFHHHVQQPNDEDPLNHEAAAVLRDNPEKFERNVQRAMAGGYVGETHFPRCM